MLKKTALFSGDGFPEGRLPIFYGPFLTTYYPGNSLAIYFQTIIRSFGAPSSLYRTDNLTIRGQQLREAEEDLGFLWKGCEYGRVIKNIAKGTTDPRVEFIFPK